MLSNGSHSTLMSHTDHSAQRRLKLNTSTAMLLRDAKLCMVAVFGIIFVVEIEQKHAIWCLKRKSLNELLVF